MTKFIWFVAGLLAGISGGYYYAKTVTEKKAQAEIDEFKASYKPEQRTYIFKKATAESEEAKYEAETINYASFATSEVKAEPSIISENSFKEFLEKKAEREKQIEEEESDETDGELYPREERNAPYVIGPDQFANENPYFDKTTLYYYSGDDVMIDEAEEIVRTPEELVGYDFEEGIGKFEKNVGYFRNEKVGADYEVILQNGSYYEDSR